MKKSKGTGGAVVGRWQEQAPRSGREKGSSPKAPKPAPAKKAKDPSVLEMLQFIKLYHLVPAQVSYFGRLSRKLTKTLQVVEDTWDEEKTGKCLVAFSLLFSSGWVFRKHYHDCIQSIPSYSLV